MRGPDWLALAATAVTVAVHLTLTFLSGRPSALFIAGACLFWTAYVVVRARQNGDVFHDWGFRIDTLGPATARAAVVLAVTAAGLGSYAAWAGTLRFPLHALVLLLVYPVWGVTQQFLALAIVVGNLQRLPWLGRHRLLLVLTGATLFGAVHLYDVRLAAGTFALELVAIPLYLRYRNLWPLGVLHGWLGALFYLWVLNQDLWVQAFGEAKALY
jgi:hypothetical protein